MSSPPRVLGGMGHAELVLLITQQGVGASAPENPAPAPGGSSKTSQHQVEMFRCAAPQIVTALPRRRIWLGSAWGRAKIMWSARSKHLLSSNAQHEVNHAKLGGVFHAIFSHRSSIITASQEPSTTQRNPNNRTTAYLNSIKYGKYEIISEFVTTYNGLSRIYALISLTTKQGILCPY